LICRGQCEREHVKALLTMIFKAALTMKISAALTINVPSSFARTRESGYKAA
jgi:hypothetical protein